MSQRVHALEAKVEELSTPGAMIVPINSFDPEPFDLVREIKVVVQPTDGEECVASLFDANVNASGCNDREAVENLKGLLLSRFEFLDSQPADKLGPGPRKQLAVLRSLIRRRPDGPDHYQRACDQDRGQAQGQKDINP